MADTHQAAYSPFGLGRKQAFERTLLVLEDVGARFDGGVRGMHWDAALEGFAYDDEDGHDIEDVATAAEAFDLSQDWECVLLDFRFLGTQFELQLFGAENQVHVAMAFSHSLYRLALGDAALASRWVDMLVSVAHALGATALLLGPDVQQRPYSEAQLFELLRRTMQGHRPGAYGVHTARIPARAFNELERHTAVPAGFQTHDFGNNGVLITLLTLHGDGGAT